MTRARARALENEVTSLLTELPYDACETWMLPHSETLCVLRYQEDPLGEARTNGQVGKFMDETDQRRRSPEVYRARTSGPKPRHPAPGSYSSSKRQSAQEATGAGHPAGGPDIRPDPRTSDQPDIRPGSPDIRPLENSKVVLSSVLTDFVPFRHFFRNPLPFLPQPICI